MKKTQQFSLRHFQDQEGKPVYFEKMYGIGPALTNEPSKAARFASKEEASRTPAFLFGLTLFTVVEAPAA